MDVDEVLQPTKIYFHIAEELKDPYPLISYFGYMTGITKVIKEIENIKNEKVKNKAKDSIRK